MICRRSLIAALLVLTLASCVDDDASPAEATALPRNPALEQLLVEADAAMASGALGDAGRKLDEARRLAPDNPDLWVATARLRFRGGEHLAALDAADRALKLGPRHAPAVLLRALMVRDAHGPEAALPWFGAALAAAPDNADVWAEYAANLGDSGRGRAMLRAVRKLAGIAPEDPRVFYLQAVLAARGGNAALARSLLVRSGLAKREVPAAMLLDAVLGMAEGNFDSAAVTLESLSARQPANAHVRELLARALLAGGREAELIGRFGVDAQRSEASPYLIMLVARAHERLGNRSAAAPLLERAFAGAGRTPTVLADWLGLPPPTAAMRQAASQGNWSAAQDQAQALRARFPASADVASLAGDAMLGAGDSRAALEAYSLASRARRPWPLTRKIVFAFRSAGNGMAADTLLARHVVGEPNLLTANAELAETLAARGDWKRAALLIDHGIALGGGHDPALLTLRIRAARALNRPADARRFAMLLAEIRPRSLTQR